MGKGLRTILAGMAEALAEGAVMLPNLMLVGLYSGHYGQTIFVMPFVLLYAFEKAGVFFIGGTGRVKNPYKVWMGGMFLTVSGCICLLFGTRWNPAWDIGAVLMGLGLSGYNAMFRTTRDALKERKAWNGPAALWLGYLILGIYTGIVMRLRQTNMEIVMVSVLLLVLFVLFFCLLLTKEEPYRGNPAFETGTFRREHFVYAVLILLLTFFVRFYKQTTDGWMVLFMAVLFGGLLVYSERQKKQAYRPYSLRTLWYGAVRNFVTIYSLIYFLAVGEPFKVTVAYLMIGCGVALAKIIAPLLKRKVPDTSYESVCMLAASLSSVLLLFSGTYMPGVLFTCAFVSCGNSASMKCYLSDPDFRAEERRLIRARFYALGAVLEQVQMLIVLFLVSLFYGRDGTAALQAYTFQEGDRSNSGIFWYTLLVCIAGNTVFGVFVQKRGRSREEKSV